jgi:hypothetical protein
MINIIYKTDFNLLKINKLKQHEAKLNNFIYDLIAMLSLIISINQDIQYTWGKKLAFLAGKRKTNNKKLKGNVEMDWRKGGETYDLYKSTNLIFPPQTPNPYATMSRHYTSHKNPN